MEDTLTDCPSQDNLMEALLQMRFPFPRYLGCVQLQKEKKKLTRTYFLDNLHLETVVKGEHVIKCKGSSRALPSYHLTVLGQ